MKQYVGRVGLPSACALALLLLTVAAPATAKSREARASDEVSAAVGPPVLAVVALSEQHVTIYDADGKILRAPVSTGQTGYETPAGIYSVLEKNREHYSNLYDDASMPFMQRITWSGIALHAGQLPGHPASHGCIRLPSGFAEHLFGITKLGLRVVIVRDDMRPIGFAHAALFKPGPIVSDVATTEPATAPPRLNAEPIAMHLGAAAPDAPRTWRAVAAAKKAEADAAAKVAEDARRAVVSANAELARAARTLRMAESVKRKAEEQLQDVESALRGDVDSLSDERKAKLDEAMEKALARVEEARAKFEAAQSDSNAKLAAAAAARDAVKAAIDAKDAAAREARTALAKTAPVSVFISRKTQRVYVRQGFQPILESEVTIRDPQAEIGTVIFTALNYTDDAADLRWNALAMYPDPTNPGAPGRHGGRRGGEPRLTDAKAARSALERISIPPDTVDRIREVVSPGSAVIISDEALSNETGKNTDFVVVMSGEPQGGIKIRRRNSDSPSVSRRDPYGDYGYRRPPSYPRPYGGGGLFGLW
ncbi:MAG TPA: L,D-transpeptidase family protein [Hyphomicrobiaceae bacterium]|nr:L,D-transpeptidase family protein [Hyphomicrobiaceae bacterium]